MHCGIQKKDGVDLLIDYCAGTLDAARAADVETHVQQCAGCRELVRAQRAVWSALGDLPAPEVSADFDARLYARIRAENEIPVWRRILRRMFQPAVPVAHWKPAASLAGAAALLAIGFLVRVPDPGDNKARLDRVDIEQVEEALEDFDMLTPAVPSSSVM